MTHSNALLHMAVCHFDLTLRVQSLSQLVPTKNVKKKKKKLTHTGWPARRLPGVAGTLMFLKNIINVINVKCCMIILLPELDPFLPLTLTLNWNVKYIYFRVTAVLNSYN